MSPMTYRLNNGRTLFVASRAETAEISKTLRLTSGFSIICLLTLSHACDEAWVEPCIRHLLVAGCRYFVCAGSRAEHLHDTIDAIALKDSDSLLAEDLVTTWHDDESAEDVAEFFIRVAGAVHGSTSVAILESQDEKLREALQQVAASEQDRHAL